MATATAPKLTAAREAGVPVVVVEAGRPTVCPDRDARDSRSLGA